MTSMMQNVGRGSAAWLLGAVLSGLGGCAAPPTPPVLVALGDKLAAVGGETADPGVRQSLEQARALHEQATKAFTDGDSARAEALAEAGQLHLEIAAEQAAVAAAGERVSLAVQRQQEAQRLESEEKARAERLAARVARMEKIIALQAQLSSEQQKSKKEAASLKSEIEQAKEDQRRLEEEQKKADEEQQKKLARERERAEVQNEVSALASKIQTADSLEAQKFDASGVQSAKTMLAEAQRSLESDDLEAARQFARTADQGITLAIKRAREEYDKQKQALDLLAQRKALLDAATALVGSDARQDDRGVVLTLRDMFAPTKSEILQERKPLLAEIAQLGRAYTAYPMIIEGYTDSQGNDAVNLTLSTSRAQAVQDHLIREEKIGAERIRSAGYGEANPTADNSTKDGRAKNRRIEVIFLFR